MEEFGEIPGSPASQTSRRAAEILDRHLPDGYSADPEVSLSAEPVEAALLESPLTLGRSESPTLSAAGAAAAGGSSAIDEGESPDPDFVESKPPRGRLLDLVGWLSSLEVPLGCVSGCLEGAADPFMSAEPFVWTPFVVFPFTVMLARGGVCVCVCSVMMDESCL
ncbi:hypothetical protein NLG97_g8826 [Lecanicillium saksenae]|uniref:Uncharacterized protein n=1 Tax=Lecanicillium saksenae TaxID=468837 RepID=A0ACC1QLP1_9HYPO|nr:hypothetical protein NLG97_g8826 [Lecanicillium saksenae]